MIEFKEAYDLHKRGLFFANTKENSGFERKHFFINMVDKNGKMKVGLVF